MTIAPPTREEREAISDETAWAICPYVSDEFDFARTDYDCRRCPRYEQAANGSGEVTAGCRLHADWVACAVKRALSAGEPG